MQSPSSELKSIIESRLVRAGAGAGKTTQLTHNIYDSVKSFRNKKSQWPKVIVTTFTKKATKELRERLVVLACEKQDMEFLNYLNSSGKIHISTIHGVLNLFLKSYGHLVGWDNSFQIMSPDDKSKLTKTILKEMDEEGLLENVLSYWSYKELLALLNSFTEIKLTYPEAKATNEGIFQELKRKHLLNMHKKCKDLSDTIYESFTKTSWLEFADKLRTLVDTQKLAFDLENLGRRPNKTKEDDPFTIEYIGAQLDSIKGGLGLVSLDQSFIDHASAIIQSLDPVANVFLEKILAVKKKLAKLDLSDLELLTFKILSEEPQLGTAFSSDWHYWLVDEYQDTSPLQEKILTQLISDRPQFVVGDPQQSIYLFRGARAEVFSNKESKFVGEKEIKNTNYRSRPEVLSFINDFFSGYDQKFLEMSYGQKFGVHDPTYKAVEFYQGIETEFVSNRILHLFSQNVKPEQICVLARKNKSLLNMAKALSDKSIPTHVHASSGFFRRREILDLTFFIRFLTNPHDDQNLISLLRTPWIHLEDSEIHLATSDWNPKSSFWIHLQTGFFNQEEGKLGQDKNAKSQWLEVKSTLLKYLNISLEFGTLFATEQFLLDKSWIELAHYQDPTGRREANIWKFFSVWREQEKKPGFNLHKFLNQSGREIQLEDGDMESDAVAAVEPSFVNLMTIHASKGLQFDYVFVLECGKSPVKRGGSGDYKKVHYWSETNSWSVAVPSLSDSSKQKTLVDYFCTEEIKGRELLESDRLFYVALTRAIKGIFISWEGDITSDSWLSRSRFELEEGSHNRAGYSYLYSQGSVEDSVPAIKNEMSETALIVRSKWNELSLSETIPSLKTKGLTKTSVSKLVNEISAATQSNQEEEAGLDVVWSHPQAYLNYKGKAHLGTDFHKWFELYRYHPGMNLEVYARENFPLKYRNDYLNAFQWTIELKEPPIKELLENGEVEWGFQHQKDNLLIEGQIDLWGTLRQNGQEVTWVIDYKSGSSHFKEKALEQLKIYAEALREFGCKNIRLAVIYPNEKNLWCQDFQ
jgi:ATP-dependent helicase/nuclease subunit A